LRGARLDRKRWTGTKFGEKGKRSEVAFQHPGKSKYKKNIGLKQGRNAKLKGTGAQDHSA